MKTKILILCASPKKNGNTSTLVQWFVKEISTRTTNIDTIPVARLKLKYPGCTSCRVCQKITPYQCVIKDEGQAVLKKMAQANVIVMASPLYFFSASAQLKILIDRMFSLYKWDNDTGTMKTVLKGKTLVLLASAYEGTGLEALKEPLALTARYSGMKFRYLLIPHAGVSGEIKNSKTARRKTVAFGKMIARSIKGKPRSE